MHIPKDYPVESILCDARFFLLPDYVKIDGTSYCICPGASNNAFDAVSSPVIDRWPQFEQYVNKIIAEVRSDAEAAASARSDVINGEVFSDFQSRSKRFRRPSTLLSLSKTRDRASAPRIGCRSSGRLWAWPRGATSLSATGRSASPLAALAWALSSSKL